jgi:hypothetical protein
LSSVSLIGFPLLSYFNKSPKPHSTNKLYYSLAVNTEELSGLVAFNFAKAAKPPLSPLGNKP